MALRLGDTAPHFTQASTIGPISFHEWAGESWVALFSHPPDYSPACTTELGRTANLAEELANRNVKGFGLRVNPVDSHKGSIEDSNETQSAEVRNFDGILRVIDSLQLTDRHQVATPVDREPGDEGVGLASIKDPGELRQRFPQGERELPPYLRMVEVPQQ